MGVGGPGVLAVDPRFLAVGRDHHRDFLALAIGGEFVELHLGAPGGGAVGVALHRRGDDSGLEATGAGDGDGAGGDDDTEDERESGAHGTSMSGVKVRLYQP